MKISAELASDEQRRFDAETETINKNLTGNISSGEAFVSTVKNLPVPYM
jgi:hypothetical protein